MNFIEAINLIDTHTVKAVRKSSWERGKYLFHDTKYTWLSITLDEPNCMSLPYSVTSIDILANDWEVYEKQTYLYSFEEAIASLRKGKSIRRKAWINRFSVDADDNNYYFTIDDLNANDWIIKEDK